MMDDHFSNADELWADFAFPKYDPEKERRELIAQLDLIGPRTTDGSEEVKNDLEEPEQALAPVNDGRRMARYLIKDSGIFAEHADGDPTFVCSPLEVEATYAGSDNRGWGKLVRLQAANGKWVSLRIDSMELQRAPSQVLGKLADCGLELGADKKAKDSVIQLLKQWKPDRHLLRVAQVGWASNDHDTFVFGHSAAGKTEVLPLDTVTTSSISGSVEEWRDNVGKLCIGNPMMILAASLAFSGPLLHICGMHGGGLHFRGASSSGKTTLLTLANSVWADRSSIRQWRATSNGIEVIAQQSNDMLLALDELAEIHARDLHGAIYMLANGVPKTRMTKDTRLQEGPRWRLAMISSGEISVAEKLREASMQAMAGHEVRLIDIEADSRRYGVFDDLHGCVNGAQLADQIQTAVLKAHATVGQKFVEKVIRQMPTVTKVLAMAGVLIKKWQAHLPADANGQVMRVAHRFAVIACAGMIATAFGLTGWPAGAAEEAAQGAFLDWYDRHHGEKQDAASDALKRLSGYMSSHATAIQMIGDDASPAISPEAWKDASRLYLSSDTWTRIMAGLDEKAVGKALLDVGILYPGDGERLMRKAPRSIPGRPRLFTVNLDRLTDHVATY